VYLEINPKVSILLVLFLVYKYVICNIIWLFIFVAARHGVGTCEW
jgi:hypothetical protein